MEENKNKYYQPKIEEFHIGFEYEIFEDFDMLPKKEWMKQVYGDNGHNPENMDFVSVNCLEKFRVKYLDREDIESLEWSDKKHPYQYKLGDLQEYELGYYDSAHSVIYIEKDGNEIFVGIIKNKSELKKLMKQLRITK